MKQCVVVTYKNGSSINIDVPVLYYSEKYKKKSEAKLHSIFLKEYSAFVKALNKGEDVVEVGKYLKFSNATVSAKDVLSVDIKDLAEEVKPQDNTVFVPGVHDKVFLDLSDTRLDALLTKLEELNIVENTDKLLQKLVSYFNKSNVEFTIKAGAKKPSTSSTRKKKTEVESEVQVASESSEIVR